MKIILNEWRCEFVQMISVILLVLPLVFLDVVSIDIVKIALLAYSVFIIMSIFWKFVSGERKIIRVNDDKVVFETYSRFSQKEISSYEYADLMIKYKYIPFLEYIHVTYNNQLHISKCSMTHLSYTILLDKLSQHDVDLKFSSSYSQTDFLVVILMIILFFVGVLYI